MSHVSDTDHCRLEATVRPDYIIESHEISDASRGWRRVPITKVWRTERLLGRGGFGEVHLQTLESDRSEKRALKVIPTRGLTMSLADCQRELVAMTEFKKHKYREAAVFVDFFGWFRNDEAMFLAMEYMGLGDLEQNLQEIENSPTHEGPALSEEETQEITRQILEGLKIMHAEGFAHRDLKPQNVFVVQKHPQWWVKLGNFGLSKQHTDQTAFRTQAGTQQYIAPELFYYVPDLDAETSEYTSAIDLWALGCILYRATVGAVPFPSLLSLRNYCRDPSKVPLNLPHSMKNAETFVEELLRPHPATRPLADAALAYPWLTQKSKPNISLHNMQPILDSMDVSAGQNNYNTATHKGLKSDYSMPTTIFAPPEPSRNGPTSEPTPFPTRELVGQPANFTSSDPNALITERAQDENTVKPIKTNMDEAEDSKTPVELSISRDTPSQPRDPSPRIHEGESLIASYGSGGVVHKKPPEPKDESNPVVEEIAGEDWWGDHGTVESKRKKDTEPSTVEPVELIPAELVSDTHKKDKEGKTTIEEPLKVEEKTEDAQLEVPASTDEFGWGSLALKKLKKDKKRKTKVNFIDEDSEPKAIEIKPVELVPAEWELDTYRRYEDGRTTIEEPLKVEEKTEEVKLEVPASTDEFGWSSIGISKKSKKDKKKKAKIDFVDEQLEVNEKTEEPEPFEEQEFDEFTLPSRKKTKKKQKRSSIAATTPDDNELDEAEALKSRGNNAMANREYTQAEVLYTLALAINPDNPVYLCNRASAYQNMGRYAAACQDAEAAVKAYPRYEKAWNRLGLAKLSLGAARDSIDAYTKALRCGTACSESSKKGLKAAEKKLDEILGEVEYPEDNLRIPRYTLEDRADQAMANKDFERAVDLYSKVLQYDPRDFVCMSNRATALLILGSYDARTDATYLTATHPFWGRSWMALGRVELSSGNVSASVDAYNKAIKFGNVETSDCAQRELTFAKQFILNHGEESTEFRNYLSSLAAPEISSAIVPITDLIRLRKEHGFELEKTGYLSPLHKGEAPRGHDNKKMVTRWTPRTVHFD